ncbi:MAG: DUF2029 domain-containing protein [Dactylosporangium sp.]|nr:DUF2029 domain-containing protein [Dactylosporangium sp.]NNJ61085.1 DUF2029 domain-containing protein [Dactylosporangium sp.]
MLSATPESTDEPARSDAFVGGLSEAVGGPPGEHAARPIATCGRFWNVTRIVLALTCLMLSLHWVQKSPCRDGGWTDLSQYKYFCYTDVLALYYAEGLSEGAVPYADHPVEYPVLTGALLGAIGLPVHAYGERNSMVNQGQLFYDLNAVVLAALGVATVGVILAVRRRRPWDAAMFALSPALFVSATVNWDLLAVALMALGMLAWARRHPAAAGVLLGLGISAKLYPLLIFGPMLLLSLRARRVGAWLIAAGAATATWAAINLPVAVNWHDNWRTFFTFNSERGIDWGTLWYIGEHFPVGDGGYGIPWFASLNAAPEHATLNALYLALFLLACIGIAVLTFTAPRKPRLAQLTFLVVAAFLLVGKVWSQQYVLWLLPLVVLARPRWGAFLAWQIAEVGYFLAFYGELMGASGREVFPEWVFVLAAILRWATVALLAGLVVRDILRPELDAVRWTYADDPDGGVLDGEPATVPVAEREGARPILA